MPVLVEATDERGVADVRVTIEDWSWTVAAEPYEVTGLAPVVDQPTDVTVQVTVTDIFGNVATASPTVQVTPRVNASAPVTGTECLWDLGFVVPGVDTEIRFQAQDDEAVESLRFLVDGLEVERVTPVNELQVEHVFLWRAPATGMAGEQYLVRLEARDFAGNVTAQQATLQVPAGTILRGGGSVFDDYAGGELTLADGTFTEREHLHVSVLRIARGATLSAVDLPGGGDPLQVTATSIQVACGGSIDASGLGYAGGTAPAWAAPSAGDAGGSHGGTGRSGTPGETYDSVYGPALAGAGGAGGSAGPGGGRVHLKADEVLLDGDLLARGQGNVELPNRTAAGAGGAVLIQAGVLRGVGALDAGGGEQNRCDIAFGSGSGGGGRIALEVGALDGFDVVTQAQAWGGTQFQCGSPDGYSGPGTVLVKLTGDAYGSLRIDNGTASDGTPREGPATVMPALGSGSVLSLSPSGTDAWLEGTEPFLPRWIGATIVLEDPEAGDLGWFVVAAIDGNGRALLTGAGAISAATSYRGEYRFDQVDVVDGGRIVASDPIVGSAFRFSGEVELSGDLHADTIDLAPGAVMRPVVGDSLQFYVSGTMTIGDGALIDVSGRGFPGGTAPAWVTPAASDAGGSHGGVGLSGVPGETYDSVYRPGLAGAGGAAGGGGPGGGLVYIEAAELALDGAIVARGLGNQTSGNLYSAGAGGSVLLQVGVLRGAGVIDASGDGQNRCSIAYGRGAGGGGRIAIDAGELDGFDPAVQALAWGGTQFQCGSPEAYAGAGTVLVKLPGDAYGRLRIDNGIAADGTGRAGPPTDLPVLGEGSLVGLAPDGVDGWVEGGAPFTPRWVGATMALLGGSGEDLGSFRVTEVDGDGRALLAGAAAVSGAVSYRGEYRFDEIDVASGGRLSSTTRSPARPCGTPATSP